MKITNVSKSKLVFAAGFALNAGQSRDATEDDLKTFNPVLIEAWKKTGLIEVEGDMPKPKPAESDADKAAKEAAEAEAKAKAEAEAKAKAEAEAKANGNGGKPNGGNKLPG